MRFYIPWLMAGLMILTSNAVQAGVGATTPFTSIEAESGALGGGASIIYLTNPPTSQYSSPQLEASGHAYVQLTSVGQYVQWTNNTGQNIRAINLRSCIPDAPNGWGISNTIDLYVDGQFRQAFSVNSFQNYCYEGTNYNGETDKNPADGDPRDFWNDTHAFISGASVAPSSTIRFQMDSTNTAAFYYIDVVDLEAPPPPLTQPANSLSILSYGAISNDMSVDNTAAINSCFNAARAQGAMAWIPPGTYYISATNGGLKAADITILGAGPWYSTLYRITPTNNTQIIANIIVGVSCTLSNMLLDCNANLRPSYVNNGAINFSGNNWLVNNVWIQHTTSAFWCAGNGGTAENCRVLSTWADGGNFNNQQSANGVGINLTYTNQFVRGTGDDGMAINSVKYNIIGPITRYYPIMSNITYINNTAICAWGGNEIGIYGGANVLVMNNLLCDSPRFRGLSVSRFGVNGSGLQSARVIGNTVLRGGGNAFSQHQEAMLIGATPTAGDAVANAVCVSNTIINSVYNGAAFYPGTNMVFQYNTIINPGSNAIAVLPGILGSAFIRSNTATGVPNGSAVFTNFSSGFPGFAAVVPITAASYNNMSGANTENCSEGGQDVTNIVNGSWSEYNSIKLTNSTMFVARVASAAAGGNIQVYLDSPTGTLLGTCTVPSTGGWQAFVDVFANLTGVTGTHNIYLVYTGGAGELFNLEFFGFYPAPPVPVARLVPGNTYSLQATANGLYVTAPNNGSNALVAQSATVGTPQEFQVVDQSGGNIALLALVNTQYVCADNNGASPLIANRSSAGTWETFTEFDAGGGNSALLAMNDGKFVAAPNGGASPLIAQSNVITAAESFTVGLVMGFAPPTPTDLLISGANSQATLAWLSSPGASGYNVKYSTTNGGPYITVAANIPTTSFTQTGLTNGVIYYYVVSATNAIGESTNSAQVNIIPGMQDRTLWVATSSTSGGDSPANALDGNFSTRWSTDTAQVTGQWFQVDLGQPSTISTLILNAINSPNDYPRSYQVNVSSDGINWGSPVATGVGSSAITTITLPTQVTRFIRITLTGPGGNYWSIDEFYLPGLAPATPSGLSAAAIPSNTVNLAWNASASALAYNVKRSTASAGPYSYIATNITFLGYTDTGLTPGTIYYYIVTGTNSYGESANSAVVSAQPVSLTIPALSFATANNSLQISWPQDHQGWTLQVETNSLTTGLNSNWVSLPNLHSTNQTTIPIDPTQGSVFFRLTYP